MESFFLAETTKYLYLLFTPNHFIHNTGNHGDVVQTPSGECILDAGGYIFNTEAHPIDMAAMYCCSAQKKQDDLILQDLHDNLDLLTLLDIVDPSADLFAGGKLEKRRKNIQLQRNKPKPVLQPPSEGETTEETEEISALDEDGADGEDEDYSVHDSAEHYMSHQDGVSGTEEDSAHAQKSEEGVVVTTSENKLPAQSSPAATDGMEGQKESMTKQFMFDLNTQKLMKQVSSKLNVDVSRLTDFVQSLGDETSGKQLEGGHGTAPQSSGSESPNKGISGEDGARENEAKITVTQDGEWVRIQSGDVGGAGSTATSHQDSTSDKTKKVTTVNAQVQALAAMIKNVLSSNSEHTYSGNSGFSLGSKTEGKSKTAGKSRTEEKSEVESKFADHIFGDDQPEQLVCLALPFHMRLSVMGEMFGE